MAESPLLRADGAVEYFVKVEGTAISDRDEVLSIRVRKDVGRIPEAILTLAAGSISSQEFPEADGSTYKVGNKITMAAAYAKAGQHVLFDGLITASRMRIRGDEGPVLELTCRDSAIILTGVRSSALYESQNDSDIMTSLISNAGLTASVTAVSSDQRDNLRYDCTDWDFLRVLAERNGQIITVDAGKVTAAPPELTAQPSLTLTSGYDIIEFDAQIDTQGLIGKASGKSWDDASDREVTESGSPPPAATWGNLTNKDLSGVLKHQEYVFTAPLRVDHSDIRAMVDARLKKSALSAMQGSCSFQGNALVSAGCMIEIRGVGDRFGGKAFVSGVEHSIEAGSWTTRARLGLPDGWISDSNELGGATASGITAPIHGLQIAQVLQITDDPNQRARIKISLPMIGATASAVWARFAQPYATQSAGIQFMPEIGDEVLVAFMNGDPNAPVVVGSLHNGVNSQTNVPDEKNTLKAITTKSKLTVAFDDEKKCITISTPGGHSIALNDNENSLTIQDLSGNKIEMKPAGITMSSPGNISITADGNVDIKAIGDATVGGANVTADASMQFAGKGGASAELSSGGQTTVKGPMVMIN